MSACTGKKHAFGSLVAKTSDSPPIETELWRQRELAHPSFKAANFRLRLTNVPKPLRALPRSIMVAGSVTGEGAVVSRLSSANAMIA